MGFWRISEVTAHLQYPKHPRKAQTRKNTQCRRHVSAPTLRNHEYRFELEFDPFSKKDRFLCKVELKHNNHFTFLLCDDKNSSAVRKSFLPANSLVGELSHSVELFLHFLYVPICLCIYIFFFSGLTAPAKKNPHFSQNNGPYPGTAHSDSYIVPDLLFHCQRRENTNGLFQCIFFCVKLKAAPRQEMLANSPRWAKRQRKNVKRPGALWER